MPAVSAAPARGSRLTQTPKPAPTQPAPVPVTVTYALPAPAAGGASAGTAGVSAFARRNALSSGSYTGYTSTAAPITFNVTVTPVGGGATSYPGGSCTAAASGTAGVCSSTFTALPGAATLAGTLVEGGNTIASFSQLEIIQPNAANTLKFTANPVVASVNLQLGAAAINAGTAQDVPLAVNALDANGNIIAGSAPYVDAGGTPLALSLSAVNAQAGGRGSVVIKGPLRITAPGQAAIYAHYDGNWLASATISVSSTRTLSGSLGTATLTTNPTAVLYSGASQAPNFITVGPDGYLYATECAVGSGIPMNIAKMSLSGQVQEFTTGSFSDCLGNIITGPDGNLWFTDPGNGALVKMTPSGSFTSYPLPGSQSPPSVAAGPDGNLWATMCVLNQSCAGIDRVTPSGGITNFTAGFSVNGATEAVTLGPDGNLWFNQPNNNVIGKITRAGKVTTYSGVTTDIGGLSDCIVTGPDKNLWFVEWNAGKVARVNTNGVLIAEYSLSHTGQCLAVGPDGDIWATESQDGYLAQVSPGGAVSEYAAGVYPTGIILGPDGNLWYADQSNETIGKFVY